MISIRIFFIDKIYSIPNSELYNLLERVNSMVHLIGCLMLSSTSEKILILNIILLFLLLIFAKAVYLRGTFVNIYLYIAFLTCKYLVGLFLSRNSMSLMYLYFILGRMQFSCCFDILLFLRVYFILPV